MTNPNESDGHEPLCPAPTAGVPSRPAHFRCGPWLGCSVALLGGLIAWGVLRCCFPVFEIPLELQNLPSPQPPELAVKAEQATIVATRWNATLTLAILGFAVAALLAGAEAFSRGAATTAWWRALIGALIAAGFAAAGGLAASWLLAAPQLLGDMSPLARTISVQCTGLGLFGLGVGVGVGLTGGGVRLAVQAGLGGLLGGVLVGFLYPPLMAYLLPNVKTEHVIPLESASQLIWLAAVAVLPTLVMTGLGRNKSRALP